MSTQKKLEYDPNSTLIFACSGASDVGEICDRVARLMAHMKFGRQACLASLTAGDADALIQARRASCLLAVDGCGKKCVWKTLQKAGFKNVIHVNLDDLGMHKGKTALTYENFERVIAEGVQRLGAS